MCIGRWVGSRRIVWFWSQRCLCNSRNQSTAERTIPVWLIMVWFLFLLLILSLTFSFILSLSPTPSCSVEPFISLLFTFNILSFSRGFLFTCSVIVLILSNLAFAFCLNTITYQASSQPVLGTLLALLRFNVLNQHWVFILGTRRATTSYQTFS